MTKLYVSTSETYDLHTTVGHLALIGIHTPKVTGLLNRLYGGLLENFKYVRPVKCDVVMACASLLPADPLQVGMETGDIAPQDMFNPILYRATSNDSFNTIEARIRGMTNLLSGEIANEGSVKESNNPYSSQDWTRNDDFKTYYGLLAQDGWRKSMPQSGLAMKGLFPMVYEVLNNLGNVRNPAAQAPVTALNYDYTITSGDPANQSPSLNQAGISNFRGKCVPMPPIPLHSDPNGDVNDVPITWVGAIVMPPARLNSLYYRMTVRWTWELSGLYPATEFGTYLANQTIGHVSYGSDYAEVAKEMDHRTSSVDTIGAPIDLVMES